MPQPWDLILLEGGTNEGDSPVIGLGYSIRHFPTRGRWDLNEPRRYLSTSRVVWECSPKLSDGLCRLRGGELHPRLNTKQKTDSEQVPWGKDEKNFEKRVKSAWNCWEGTDPVSKGISHDSDVSDWRFLYSNVYSIFSFVSKAELKEWSISLLLKTSQHQFNRWFNSCGSY